MVLAVFDDLGAILIIALLYTERLVGETLFVAGIAVAGFTVLNRLRVMRVLPYPYMLLGLLVRYWRQCCPAEPT